MTLVYIQDCFMFDVNLQGTRIGKAQYGMEDPWECQVMPMVMVLNLDLKMNKILYL